MKDPIVDEIRKFRMAHTQEFNSDIGAICDDLRKLQEKSGHKIVKLRSQERGPQVKSVTP